MAKWISLSVGYVNMDLIVIISKVEGWPKVVSDETCIGIAECAGERQIFLNAADYARLMSYMASVAV